VGGALEDVRQLFREEVALARAELRQEASKATAAAAAYGAAAVAGWFAGTFLLTAIALGIAEAMDWPLWTGFAIVGVSLAAAAGLMFVVGRYRARAMRAMPHTVHTVRETVERLS
jgi:hypothetical protein